MNLLQLPQAPAHEKLLFSALHDPENWSLSEGSNHVRLLHANGSMVVARAHPSYVIAQEPFLHRLDYSPSMGSQPTTNTRLIDFHLDAPCMTLDLWALVRAPLWRGDAPRIQALLRSMLLRHDPAVQGTWGVFWNAPQHLAFTPLKGQPTPGAPEFKIPTPPWMIDLSIPLYRWLDASCVTHVRVGHAINAPLDMETSSHQRMEELHRVSSLPEVADPAFGAAFGLI